MSKFVERPRYVCSPGGAVGTIKVLPRTVPILHAATGCGGNVATALNQAAGYFGSGYCAGQALVILERNVSDQILKDSVEQAGLYKVTSISPQEL